MSESPGTCLAPAEIERKGIGPFVTARRLRRADGSEVEFSAWHHRKGHGLIDRAARARRPIEWWAPHRRGWWIAVLFMAGTRVPARGQLRLPVVRRCTPAPTRVVGRPGPG